MTIKNLSQQQIISDRKINSIFLSVFNKKLKVDCKILNSDFYLDSFNYFPLTTNNNTFKDVFSWGDSSKYNNFYTDNFNKIFIEKKNGFKNFSKVFILGSSASDNYYRNLLTFLPRIFFINDREINLAIHRKSSNKFRVFIREILKQSNIKLKKFTHLDDDFYKFNNSQIPQFFNIKTSARILSNNLSYKKINNKLKIYLSRQNSNYRNLINEGDLIDKLKSKDFMIIDTNNMSIFEQIKIFSSAKVIIGPTSSALTNIVFSKKGTKVIEICPKYIHDYENSFKSRYSEICSYLNLHYTSIEADPVDNKNVNQNIKKFIPKKILNESNYYKDLLIKINKIEKIIDDI